MDTTDAARARARTTATVARHRRSIAAALAAVALSSAVGACSYRWRAPGGEPGDRPGGHPGGHPGEEPGGHPHGSWPSISVTIPEPSTTGPTAPSPGEPHPTTAPPTTVRPRPPVPPTAPRPTTPPPTATPPGPTTGTWQSEMLAAVNAERAKAGLRPMMACASLDRSAQKYADELAARKVLSHTGADGSLPAAREQAAGYGNARLPGQAYMYGAENIAQGYPTVSAVMAGWMGSKGHRDNILAPATTHLGVGRSGTWWVQNFGTGGTC